MIKKIKYIKKFVIISAIGAFMVSTASLAVGTITCSVSTSFLKKSAEAEAYSCAAVGCIIYNSSGDVLASGENGYYNTNAFRTKSVSYTGLSSADNAWAYAVDTNGGSTSKTVYY